MAGEYSVIALIAPITFVSWKCSFASKSYRKTFWIPVRSVI
jgi:hypothetical protein